MLELVCLILFELVCFDFVWAHCYDFEDYGSSHPGLSFKKGFVKIFDKFVVKYLCWSLFFEKQPPEVFC